MLALDSIFESSERRLLRSAKLSVNPTVSFLERHSFIYLLQFHLLLTFFTSLILFSSNSPSSVSSSGSSYSMYYLSSLYTALADVGQLNHREINRAGENICTLNKIKRCHMINTWTCPMGTQPSKDNILNSMTQVTNLRKWPQSPRFNGVPVGLWSHWTWYHLLPFYYPFLMWMYIPWSNYGSTQHFLFNKCTGDNHTLSLTRIWSDDGWT
jgi:hypothetical protein